MLLIIFLAEGASIDIDSDEESPQQQGMREMIQTQRKLQSSDAEIDVHQSWKESCSCNEETKVMLQKSDVAGSNNMQCENPRHRASAKCLPTKVKPMKPALLHPTKSIASS